MLGFFIGTICLIALIKVVRWGRWQRRGYGGHWRSRWMFRRLGTTSEQEKVIWNEVMAVREAMLPFRGEWLASKKDLVALVRAEQFEPSLVDAMFKRHDEVLNKAREAATAAMARLHTTLDASQREKVADMLSWGGHHAYGRGC